MNKPSWNDAPEFAEYLAMDSDGTWYWYEFKPEWDGCRWNYTGGVMLAGELEEDASETLEKRP